MVTMARRKVAYSVAAAATQYMKLQNHKLARRKLGEFDSYEDACVHYAAIELAVGSAQLSLVFSRTLNIKLWKWRMRHKVVAADLDVLVPGTPHRFKARITPVGASEMQFELNAWVAPSAAHPGGRSWLWRSRAKILHRSRQGPAGFAVHAYRIRFLETNGKPGFGH